MKIPEWMAELLVYVAFGAFVFAMGSIWHAMTFALFAGWIWTLRAIFGMRLPPS